MAAALVSSRPVAHAATESFSFTANGPTVADPNTASLEVPSTSFLQFNASLGTLTGLAMSLSGDSTPAGSVGEDQVFFGAGPDQRGN